MPTALRAFPELLWRPGVAWLRIPQFHLGAAALTADLDLDICHGRNSIIACMPRRQPGQQPELGNIVPAVVLAAGRSRRMGRAKALLPTGPGEPTFIARIIRALREGGVDDVIVVVAVDDSRTVEAVRGMEPPARVVVNPDSELGQLSSLKVGLRTVDHPGVGAVMVTLVDVPLVSSRTVSALLNAYRRTRAPIVRPARAGRHGHPVIFDRSVFEDVRQASEAQRGAKAVVQAYRAESVDVPIDEDGPFNDIDTPADYERVFGIQLPEQ